MVLFLPVLGIQIRMFLGIEDPGPDQLARGTDPNPAPDPSLFWYNVCKNRILIKKFSKKFNF